MKHLSTLFLAFALIFSVSKTAFGQNKASSRVAFKVKEISGINITDGSSSVTGKITYRVIYSQEILKNFTDASSEKLTIDFDKHLLIVVYNGFNSGSINPLGATYLLKPRYLKIGYSILKDTPFQPYIILQIDKLDFKRLDILPYKQYVRSQEKWF